MPVLVLHDRCDELPHCFAAAACPNDALFYAEKEGTVVVLPERCGDCRGPCLNFCDRYALRYAPTLEELLLLQAELDGTMSAEQIAKERLRLKEAEEKRRAGQIPLVTSMTFQREILQARLPVLLEVWANWSAPCRQMAPLLERLVQQYVGRLLIRRVNGDVEQQLLAALRVRGIPTYLFFHEGQLLDGVSGALAPAQLEQWVSGLLDQVEEEPPTEPPGSPGFWSKGRGTI